MKMTGSNLGITKADRDACHAPCRKDKARATLRRLFVPPLQDYAVIYAL